MVTSDGGRISSNASTLRSSAYWHSARDSAAPLPRCIVNIAPLILVARSLSRMPRAVPVSQCGTRRCSGNSAARLTGPLTSGLSVLARRRRARRDAAGWGCAAARRADRSGRCRTRWPAPARGRRVRGCATAAPRHLGCRRLRRNCPTAFDRSLTSARIASRLATMSRDSASKAIARSSWSITSGWSRRPGRCEPHRDRCATNGHRSQIGEVTRAQRVRA